jgi:hypothetical protein
MGFWAIAAPIVGSIASGLLGGKSASKNSKRSLQAAERARQDAMSATSWESIMGILNSLYPGAVPGSRPAFAPAGAPREGVQGSKSIGGSIVSTIKDWLDNPGISTVGYERAQEQANIGLNAGRTLLGGMSSSMGSGSPYLASIMAGLANANTLARTEAARDYTILDEEFKDKRKTQAISGYTGIVGQALQVAGQQSAAAAGQGFPNVTPVNPYEGLSQGLSMAAYLASNKDKAAPAQQEVPWLGGLGVPG